MLIPIFYYLRVPSIQVSEAKKEVRDRHYEEEVARSAAGELQSKAGVMGADCAKQLRAAEALRAAIKQLSAASEVLAEARKLEDAAAARNVHTVSLEKQARVAQDKVRTLSSSVLHLWHLYTATRGILDATVTRTDSSSQ